LTNAPKSITALTPPPKSLSIRDVMKHPQGKEEGNMEVKSITLLGVEYDFGLHATPNDEDVQHSRKAYFRVALEGDKLIRVAITDDQYDVLVGTVYPEPYTESGYPREGRGSSDRKRRQAATKDALAAGLIVETDAYEDYISWDDDPLFAPAGALAEEWAKLLTSPVARQLQAV
jgi:hypothetical protein